MRYKVVYRDPSGRQLTKNFDTRRRTPSASCWTPGRGKARGEFIDPSAGKIRVREVRRPMSVPLLPD
jgi:hypothetical protein